MESHEERKGLCSTLILQCVICKTKQTFTSSPNTKEGTGGFSAEVNKRSVVAASEVGLGRAALADFCGYMDLPPPVGRKSYQTHLKNLHTDTDKVSDIC